MPEIIHHVESPGQRWNRLRREFKKQNQERIRAQLVPDFIHTPMVRDGVLVGHWIHWQKPTGLMKLPEYHDMEGCEPNAYGNHEFSLVAPVPDHLVEALDRQAKATAAHDTMEVPDNVGLIGEDVDGPPIDDLNDETQFFAAIDEMKRRGDDGEQ